MQHAVAGVGNEPHVNGLPALFGIRAPERLGGSNVERADQAADAVTETSSLARGSGEALGEIVRLVSGTSQQVRAIALGAEEQAVALRDVTEAVSEISRVAAETAEGMEESAQAVEGLMAQTGRLRGLIDGMASTGPAALT